MNDPAVRFQFEKDNRPHLLTIEKIAVGALFLAVFAFSLIRVDIIDTPWHLATAREAFATGHWPVRNSFSYTYPDYPLYQQYPIYQTLLYLVYLLGGWEGLSILHCTIWMVTVPLWIRWGGGVRAAAMLSVPWLLAVFALHTRMILRPDILTILLFVCLLHVVDSYRRGSTWLAAVFVVLQWLMVNSHQLYPLGLATQGALLVHVASARWFGGRWGISADDARLPLWPLAIALAVSVLACLATPLGLEIIHAPAHTASSLYHHRRHVDEFAPFYAHPSGLVIVMLATVFVAGGFWKSRRNWQPFDLLLWLIATGVVSAAIRGVAIYTAICVSLFARNWVKANSRRVNAAEPAVVRMGLVGMIARLGAACLTVGVCFVVCYALWVSPPRGLLGGGIQPGIGMALGQWPSKALDFLKRYPPPGRMLNMPWYTGNPLIWDLYPQQRVFVDPRFEAYPRNFLLETIQAEGDDALLARQVAEYRPGWIVAEVRRREIHQRVANLVRTKEWVLVYADTVLMVLVRNLAENAAYIAAHRLDPAQISPQDYLDGKSYPDLLALQQIRVASLLRDFGQEGPSLDLIRKAEPLAKSYAAVRTALDEFQRDSR